MWYPIGTPTPKRTPARSCSTNLWLLRSPSVPIWTPPVINSCSNASLRSANDTLTKFLKTYLGVPYFANNAITHFLTNTTPLVDRLARLAPQCLGGLAFPPELDGYRLSFLNGPTEREPYDSIKLIPSHFWRSKTFQSLPQNYRNRKSLCREIYDFNHSEICKLDDFHNDITDKCICIGCNEQMTWYHQYFCKNNTWPYARNIITICIHMPSWQFSVANKASLL